MAKATMDSAIMTTMHCRMLDRGSVSISTRHISAGIRESRKLLVLCEILDLPLATGYQSSFKSHDLHLPSPNIIEDDGPSWKAW